MDSLLQQVIWERKESAGEAIVTIPPPEERWRRKNYSDSKFWAKKMARDQLLRRGTMSRVPQAENLSSPTGALRRPGDGHWVVARSVEAPLEGAILNPWPLSLEADIARPSKLEQLEKETADGILTENVYRGRKTYGAAVDLGLRQIAALEPC